MVEVAPARGPVAAGESAGFVADPEPAFQRFRDLVAVAADREHDPGLRVGEQPGEARGSSRESAGRVGVDRPVPFEVAGFLAVAEESQHWDGHVDGGADAFPEAGWGDPVDQEVGEYVRPQLRESAGFVRSLQAQGRVGDPVVRGLHLVGGVVEPERGHSVGFCLEDHLAVCDGFLVPGGDRLRVQPFAAAVGPCT